MCDDQDLTCLRIPVVLNGTCGPTLAPPEPEVLPVGTVAAPGLGGVLPPSAYPSNGSLVGEAPASAAAVPAPPPPSSSSAAAIVGGVVGGVGGAAALAALLGLLAYWRHRRQQQEEEQQRRKPKEVEWAAKPSEAPFWPEVGVDVLLVPLA